MKVPAFHFRVDGTEHFENGAFRKRWRHDDHVISLTEFSSNTNPKWPVIVEFLNSSSVVWTENTRCLFRVKPSFLNSSGVMWTGLKQCMLITCGPVLLFIFSAVKRYDALAALGAAGMVDIQNLVKWIGKLDLIKESWLSTSVKWTSKLIFMFVCILKSSVHWFTPFWLTQSEGMHKERKDNSVLAEIFYLSSILLSSEMFVDI